jgi:hypothetical protein
MDNERFDDLVRRLGSAPLTRSRAIRGLAGGALALLTGATLLSDSADARKKRHRTRRRKARLQAQRAPQADAGKVTICHHTGSETNPIVKITVSANAAEAHVDNHGDFIFRNCCEDSDCSDDGDSCTREICVAGVCRRRRVPGQPDGAPCQASVDCCSGCCTPGPVGGSPFCTSTGPVPCLPPLP